MWVQADYRGWLVDAMEDKNEESVKQDKTLPSAL